MAGEQNLPFGAKFGNTPEIADATKIAVFGDADGSGLRLIGYVEKSSLAGIPLSGTVDGSPVTGDIEINSEDFDIVKIFSNDAEILFDNDNNIFEIKKGDSLIRIDNGVISIIAIQGGFASSFILNGNFFAIGSEDTDSKGLISEQFFNKQNDPNAFAQLGDIGTGFESGFTSTAQVIPATTDTIITLAGATFESDGGLNLIDGTSGKITPLQQGDVIDIDIAMPLLTPIGTNEYCTMTLVPFGTTDVYRAITHQFIKGAGNQDYISANWTVPIGADIITAGGLTIHLFSTAGVTLDQKYISVTRIHKAKTTP